MRNPYRILPTALLCSISLSILSGCVLGPQSLRHSRLNYNRAVQETTREELLLNLVRMRYHESEEFLRVPSITGQYSYDAALNGSGSWNDTAFQALGLGFGLGAQSRPTIVFAPEQDKEFHQRKLTPISAETLDLLGSKGWAIDRLLRLTVSKINDIDNATSAGGPTPQLKPDYEEFLYLTQLFRQLQLQDQSLELVRIDKVTDSRTPVSDALPLDRISGEDMIQAAEHGYQFQFDHDRNEAVLWKKEVKTKVPAFRFATTVQDSEILGELYRILGLLPGLPFYEVQTDVEIGHLGVPSVRRTGVSPEREDITLSTRSLKEMMHYLSHSVNVPPEHYEKNYVRLTLDAEGNVFDWNEMTEGLFHVYFCKHKPKDAAISVKFRGYWFYLSDSDLDSKSTFNLLLELINLEIRAGGGQQLPLLTI